MHRRTFLKNTAAAVVLTSIGQGSRCRQSGTADRPNVVVFFSDELAPEFLSCYGGKISTPHLDRLAQQGVRFERAYSSAPQCTPSRYSVLTGRYPGRCKAPSFLDSFPQNGPYSIAWNTWIDDSVPTVARILSQDGYFTGMAGKWHVGEMPEHLPVPQFDEDDRLEKPETDKKLQKLQKMWVDRVKTDAGFDYAASVVWQNYDNLPMRELHYHNFPWINKGAETFLEQAAEKQQPFFLYVATSAVHGPNHAEIMFKDMRYTPGGRDDSVLDYQMDYEALREQLKEWPAHMHHKVAGMACLDYHVGRVLKKLKSLGLDGHTMVFFTADHNTEPGKATCYEKGFHVPMLMRWPGHTPPGTTVAQQVQTVDLMPSILQAAGITAGETLVQDGASLLPVFKDPSVVVRDYIYYEAGYARGVSDGRFKYIAFRYPADVLRQIKSRKIDYAPNYLNVWKQAHSQIAIEHYPHYFDADQLYDLQSDPYEQNNLAGDPKYAQTLSEMQNVLKKYLASFDHPYDLDLDPFLKTPAFEMMVKKTRAVGTGYIKWLPRDHGKVVWPPEQ